MPDDNPADIPDQPAEHELHTLAGFGEHALRHQRWLDDVEARAADGTPRTDEEREYHAFTMARLETAMHALTAAGMLPGAAPDADRGELIGAVREYQGRAMLDLGAEPAVDHERMFRDPEYRLAQRDNTAAIVDRLGDQRVGDVAMACDLTAARDFAMLRSAGITPRDMIDARRSGIRLGVSTTGAVFERAISTGVAGSGQQWIPTEFESMLYTTFWDYRGFRQCGPQRFDTPDGRPMEMPTVAGFHDVGTDVAAMLTAESGAIAETQDTTGEYVLRAYKATSRIDFSTEMLTDSGVNLSAFAGESMGRVIANKVEYAGLYGSGTNQPQGPLNSTTIVAARTTAAGAITEITYGDVLRWIYDIPSGINEMNLRALMRRSTWGNILSEQDDDGSYIFAPMSNATQREVQGTDIMISPFVADIAANAYVGILADWYRAMAYREVSTFIMRFDPYTAMANGQERWYGELRFDTRVRDTRAIQWLRCPAS